MPRRWVTMRAMSTAAWAMRSIDDTTFSTDAMASASLGVRTASTQTARMSWTRASRRSPRASTSSPICGSPKYTAA
jgi:hypothetical protein